MSRIATPDHTLRHVSINRESLSEELRDQLGTHESFAKNASVRVTSFSPVAYEVTSSSDGMIFDYADIEKQIVSAWSVLSIPDIFIASEEVESEISESEVEEVAKRVPEIIGRGAIDLTYTDPHTKRPYTWTITEEHLVAWIEAQKDEEGTVGFGLVSSSTKAFLEEQIAMVVNVEAESAKFEVGENGKIKEFRGSRPGIGLDIDETYAALNHAFSQRTWHDEGIANSIPVVVEQVEPEVKTGEVNDLGINEILGVGYSNYSGSPANRVRNIRHAVYNKLNGLLIKPDEEFSLLNALRPFTIDGGYLPELVIKGEKIEPEIGGGLCQIGSTMFRAAMNSGLPITERRNHSLVVSYYNDHRNGNPGTDATIYDPAPDFRFKNDTGHYILLTTEMNTETGDLYFTLWGTNDGRKGSYSEPVVSQWIPHGPVKEIETTELAPGQRKCQGAHSGAVASFTYTRELPSGETIDRVFESYYRPLPTICLVGVGQKQQEQQSERVCEILPTGQERCTSPEQEPASTAGTE
jgi:vancomycin resistance protein YoaR